MNLYVYVSNDPVNLFDPIGKEELKAGATAEATFGLGVKGGIQITYDTESFQLGAEVQLSARAGLSVGGDLNASISKSSGDPDGVTVDGTVDMDANISVIGASKEIAKIKSDGDKLKVEMSDKDVSGGARTSILPAKVKTSLKVGARVGGSVGLTATVKAKGKAVDATPRGVTMGSDGKPHGLWRDAQRELGMTRERRDE